MDPSWTLFGGSICKSLKSLVGASGFEPPTSWSRTRRSSQAEPRPDVSSSLDPRPAARNCLA